MNMVKQVLWAGMSVVCFCASAQDISMEEMLMLDQWRAQYSAKGIQLKPEDEVRLLQRVRAMKSLSASPGAPVVAPIVQQLAPQPVQSQAVAPAIAAIAAVLPNAVAASPTEATLRAQLDALPVTKPLSSFALLRDGLKFNGQRYVDPEGTAQRFALDPETATAAYVVQAGASATVRIARLGSGAEAVTIGRLTKNGNQTVFQSVTGKTLTGDLFFPLTNGVLLVRDSVGFRYVVGEGAQQIDFPAGWGPAPLQRGNTSTTGWFLLERDTTEEKNNPFAVFKSLGELAGALPARMDYALFNLNDRALVPFEVSSEGKSVASYSQCRRTSNGLFNRCDQMSTYDSLWKPDGSPNTMHYFWTLDWQKMQGKPVAVVMEHGLAEVNAYDLSGTKKVNLYQRMLGINGWTMELSENGKYRATAQLAFEKSVIEDVLAELQTRPEVARRP